jgi:hypothetical protein
MKKMLKSPEIHASIVVPEANFKNNNNNNNSLSSRHKKGSHSLDSR